MLTLPEQGDSTNAPPHDQAGDALTSTYAQIRNELLAERNAQGYWVGRLSSSPLSTATAISALAIAEQHANKLDAHKLDSNTAEAAGAATNDDLDTLTTAYQGDLSELLMASLRWLAEQQNDDGGWGDTDRSRSNLATTMLVLAAFRLTGVPAKHADLEPRAEEYIRRQGGVAGLRKRYGKDKTFAAPILANCALAGVVPWRHVPALPFELAAMPQRWFKWLRLPVVSYALPALVAIGLVKFRHAPPWNPITGWLRNKVASRCLALITRMQPDSGGFLEATPLTSFVVMALAGAGHADHPVVRRGVEFLLASVREDDAWPIDTDLACWNTTLALNALAQAGVESNDCNSQQPATLASPSSQPTTANSIDWLLAHQHTERHPFTDAEPGGWAWTNLSGGVPDADDTPGALLVLARQWRANAPHRRADIARAARAAINWLLKLQNTDGGWPTFCRGWGKLPFDRSATDLTAHALRALAAWRMLDGWRDASPDEPGQIDSQIDSQIDNAIAAGLHFLIEQQSADGSWRPLWFGNEQRPDESNPVYGTARVLLALNELRSHGVSIDDPTLPLSGVTWLLEQQHADGGWGSAPLAGNQANPQKGQTPVATVEETAVALEALLSVPAPTTALTKRIEAAIDWLVAAIQRGDHRRASPIGLYFAKLWYYERLYPLVFATSALGAAVRHHGMASAEPLSPDASALPA